MRDLAAQVTSSLLRFPKVTIDALGEDEVTLDSVLLGRFTVGKTGLAWLACGPHLEVVYSLSGERFSAYRFSGLSEHPPTVLAVRDFSWLKRTGLLVGIQESEGSMLCLYDLGISRVVKAVAIPGRITAIEPLVSYGGASANTQHLHQSLRWFFGVAAVVTDIGHVLLVDLCLDDLSCSQSELEASDLEIVNKSPSEIPRLREGVTQQGRHLCLQLSSPSGSAVTSLQYIHRTNQLAAGFSDGYLQLWNMKTLKKEYHSQLDGGRVPVYAFTFQEPENDPRNCCYLWAVQSAQDHECDVVSLHLLQLAFGERKCLASGKIIYEGLEYCEERYSQDLNGTAFPLRAQATNTRLIGCQTIEKFRHHSDRDDSMNEVASPDTSVSVFIWQVKSYGQGQPSTFIGVFDINRWYHAQMPDSLRAGESLRNCPYLAVWSLDGVMETTARNPVMDVQVHERSLSRGLFYTCPPPEQFFSPTTYNFEGSCLLAVGIVHFTCSGHQKEALSYLRSVTPSLSDSISTGYTRCLVSGLLSSRFTDVQASSLSQEEQLEAILCTAVETSSLGFITGCIKQWTAEEQPGTAVNLRYILEWAWNKVVHTKEELDDTCAPLFDNSANFTDPQTLQLLQHRQRLLANLSTVFHCLLSEAHELTQKGLLGLLNKCLVSSLISQYAQVVLWFCRTGLLPEGPEDDVTQISRPFYSHSIIKNYYISQREELCKKAKDKWSADCLMIDGLVSQCGDRLAELWRRDEGGTGKYPPSSLHALLDIYLLENIEESAKHAIVIYLLLDVMYSFPNKSGASVESFPTAFAIPIGLVKLVQGLWLLDHHDHESSMELLLHPSTSNSLWSWQHQRVLQALMCQQKHSTALRYLHVMKPSLCSTQHAKLCLSVLLHNRCIVEAWALIREQCNKLNMEGMMRFLFEACQELGLMKDLLKLPLSLSEQECLQRFLQTTGGFQNQELLMVHYLQQANYVPALQLNQTLKLNLAMDRDPKMKEKSSTRNSILNQYGKVLPRVQRKLAVERSKPYQHPPTIHREVKRPQPLSTVAKRSTSDHVMTRATFINNVLSKIDEVWVAKNLSPDSPSQSSTESEAPVVISSPPNQSEAFVGTPINMLHKRVSRLLDLVAHPSAQNSPALHGSPSRSKYPWASPKSVSKAPELSLLQTPQVVKRARALASAPVFSAFTPQSILRSSLRPTPVATPSASPGRSITPPVRPKESRITFIEEKEEEEEEEEEEAASLPRGAIRWDRETPKRSSPPPKAWSEESDAEEEMEVNETHSPPLVIRDGLDVESDGEIPEQDLSSLLRPCLGHEAGPIPNQSDTTLEFHHAPVAVESLREPGQNDSVDWEVTVRLPNSSEDDVPPEDNLSEVKPPEILTLDTEVHNTEEVSEKPSDSQTERLGLEVGENDISLVENVTEDQCKEAEVLDLKPNGFESKLVPVQEPSVEVLELPGQEPSVEILEVSNKEPNIQTVEVPVLETNAEVMKLPVQQPNVDGLQRSEHEIPETEESANTSSIFFEALSVPPLTEQNLESSEEGLITVSHQAEATQEPVGESSVVMFPAVEMENDEAEAEVEEHKEESMETSDLDVFVEQQLFGADLFAPSIRDASVSSFENEPVYKPEEVHPAAENPTETLIFTSDLPPTESRSVPVVTLHDSDDLSSVDSAGDSEDEKCGEESVEEDSGSEVEIIEEVQGNGRSHHQLHPAVYLEELPQHQQYFPEESNAVLAMVTSQAQVEDGDVPDEHSELMMVDFGPADVDGADGACYTELKPSTTLLVPLEMVEVQHRDLLDGEPLQTPDVMLPEDSNGFTLMLEPDVEDAPQFNHAAELQENVKDLDVESPLTTHDEQAVSEDSPRIPNNTSEEAKDATENEPVVPTNEEQSEEPSSDVTFQPITTAESQTLRQESEPLSNGDAILSPDESHDVLKSIQAENVPCPEESSQAANHLSSSDSRFITDAAEGEVKSICTVSEDVSTIKETRPKSPGRSKSPARSRVAGADVPETMKDLPKSPSRRTRKTVTFPETIDAEAEELMDSQLPSTPRRVTRSAKPLLEPPLPPTPRRSARRADAEETLPASPARRTPQKSTPRKVSRKADGEKVETLSEEAPPPVEIFGEVVDDAPEDQIQSKMQASPGRVTRKSTRGLALGCLQDPAEDQLPVTPPRSRRTSRASPSRRLTRSQHWSQAEEEQQSLENTQSDALAQRLQKDVENSVPAVTEIIHARRRTTRSLAQPQSSAVEEMVSVGEEPVRKPVSRRSRAQKAAEENLEAGDGSITAQTDLRRTRGKKEVATKPLEDASPEDSVPLPVVESHLLEETDEANLKEEAAVEAELSKPRKKRTARTKAAAEPPAPVQVSFLSPAASPDKPSSGAASSAGEKPTPSLRMNLRRKRMLDAIFAKPVTRRKKL